MSYSDFRDVDQSKDAKTFVEYLARLSEHPLVRERNERRVRALGDITGATVLDLGCGIGSDCRLLAQYAGSDGYIVGIDKSETMITAARTRNPGPSYQLATADALPFAANCIDVCWIERTLVHVDNPNNVLNECHRVLRRGGFCVVTEMDYAGIMMDATEEVSKTHEIILRHATSRTNRPQIGRALVRLLRKSGFIVQQTFDEIYRLNSFEEADTAIGLSSASADAIANGSLLRSDADVWREHFQNMTNDSAFTCLIPVITVFAKTDAVFGGR